MTVTHTPKKSRKVATTIRLDPGLKAWAKSYAEYSGTDLSTLITVTLTQIQNKSKSIDIFHGDAVAYNKHLDDMIDRVESGEEKVSGPFSTKEELAAYFDTLMK